MDWTTARSFTTGLSCGLFAMPLGVELFHLFSSAPRIVLIPELERQQNLYARSAAVGCYLLGASQLALYHRREERSNNAFIAGAMISAVYPTLGYLTWQEPLKTRLGLGGIAFLRQSLVLVPLIALQLKK